MAKATFNEALARVLRHEGGKVDDPRDPGGRTNQGVIQRVYDGYRKRKGQKPRDVWLMDARERNEIYRVQYWNAVRGDELPAGVDYVVFDGAVNSGPMQSVKWLQRALRMNAVDGHIGEATLQAVANHPDHDRLIADICDRRMAFLKALKHWPTYGRGWSRRVDDMRHGGQCWALGSIDPNPVQALADGAGIKASLSDAKSPPATAPADTTAGAAAAGTATAAGILESTKEALAPLTGSSKWIDMAFAALVVTGAAVAVGGLLWALYARSKRRDLADALDLAAT